MSNFHPKFEHMRYSYFFTLLSICLAIGVTVSSQENYTSDQGWGSELSGLQPDAKKQKSTVSETVPGMEIRAGLGFFTGFPLGFFNHDTYTGYGVNADGEYFVMPQLSVGLNTGYYSFRHDEIHVGKGNYSMIPIMLRGTWYFFDNDFQPFGGLNAGYYMNRTKYDSVIEPRSYLDPVSGQFIHKPGAIKPINLKSGSLAVVPMAGCVYRAFEKVRLNFHVRYNMILEEKKTINVIGIHFGFIYSFDI